MSPGYQPDNMPVQIDKFREDKAVSENGALRMWTPLGEPYNKHWAVNNVPNIFKGSAMLHRSESYVTSVNISSFSLEFCVRENNRDGLQKGCFFIFVYNVC